MNDIIYSIDVRVSQHEDCNVNSITDLLNVATNGTVNLVDVRQANENEETKDAIYKILEAKDERITHLLGLLDQAKESIAWVASGPLDMGRTLYAKILLAKIEKEEAK